MPTAQFTENPIIQPSAFTWHTKQHQPPCETECHRRTIFMELSQFHFFPSIDREISSEFLRHRLGWFLQKEKYLEVEENIFMILLLGRPCSRVCLRFGNFWLKGSTHIIISHYTITTKKCFNCLLNQIMQHTMAPEQQFSFTKKFVLSHEKERWSQLCVFTGMRWEARRTTIVAEILTNFLGVVGALMEFLEDPKV